METVFLKHSLDHSAELYLLWTTDAEIPSATFNLVLSLTNKKSKEHFGGRLINKLTISTQHLSFAICKLLLLVSGFLATLQILIY